jgi:tight adherence protein C
VPVYVVLAALAVSLSVPILLYSLALDRPPRTRITRQLQTGLAERGDLRTLVLSQSSGQRIGRPAVNTLGRAARLLTPSGMVTQIERRVELSGVAWSVERFLVLKLALAVGLLAAGLARAVPMGGSNAYLIAVGAALAGYLGPDAVLTRMAAARQLALANALPDLLDQLSICVEAGLGFDSALARIAGSGRGPLAGEIGRLLQDLRVGVPRAEALNGMMARTDVPELRQFVHALIQAESYGVPISRVLRTQATDQREKRRFRAEERAMKLPVKVVFPLLLCILPVLFIVVIGPAFIRITTGL